MGGLIVENRGEVEIRIQGVESHERREGRIRANRMFKALVRRKAREAEATWISAKAASRDEIGIPHENISTQ